MTSSGARAQASPLPSPLAARGARRITLAAGAAMLALGILLFFRPYDSLGVTAVLLGIALLATGVLRLVRGVTRGGAAGTHRGAHLLIGILAVVPDGTGAATPRGQRLRAKRVTIAARRWSSGGRCVASAAWA
jgi:Short repeat of unknown function (DUF308)